MRFKLIYTLLISILYLVSVIPVFAVDCSTAQDPKPAQCQALEGAKGSASPSGLYTSNSDTTDVATVLGRIVGIGLQFIGVAFMILMIYGGFRWMLARGNEAEVQKAKDLIEAAVFGLIIVLGAYVITSFVGGEVLDVVD